MSPPKPASDSSGKRKLTAGKYGVIDPDKVTIAPVVQDRINKGEVSVWWTCALCGLKVFHHKNLPVTRAHVSKQSHLKKTHNNAGDGASVDTDVPQETRHESQRNISRRRAMCFSEIVQKEGWPGLHKVKFVQRSLPKDRVGM